MPVRAKTRSTSKRRTTAVAAKPSRMHRPGERSRAKVHVVAKHGSGPSLYTKAMRFLASLSDYERMRIVRYTNQNFDLDRMRTLLRKLGNPQDHFRSVHVAGTKGKGSTCAMVAAMLEGNGYKVGLYSSPHLVDIRERIQINGEMIPHAEFARLIKMIMPMVTRARPTPTYFDVLTAVALKYF